MTKEDFINLLKRRGENASVSGGRFVRYQENEDSWSYEKNPVEYTYEEFAKLYYLI
jgi:hypothetical protein